MCHTSAVNLDKIWNLGNLDSDVKNGIFCGPLGRKKSRVHHTPNLAPVEQNVDSTHFLASAPNVNMNEKGKA